MSRMLWENWNLNDDSLSIRKQITNWGSWRKFLSCSNMDWETKKEWKHECQFVHLPAESEPNLCEAWVWEEVHSIWLSKHLLCLLVEPWDQHNCWGKQRHKEINNKLLLDFVFKKHKNNNTFTITYSKITVKECCNFICPKLKFIKHQTQRKSPKLSVHSCNGLCEEKKYPVKFLR